MISGSNHGGKRLYPSSKFPEQLWGPPSLLQWVTRVLFSEAKQLAHKANHSPPHTAEIKDECSYTSTTPSYLHSIYRDNFTILHSFLLLIFLFMFISFYKKLYLDYWNV
jgi:hypothetical protein